MHTFEEISSELKALHEEHLLRFYDTLTADEQSELLEQLGTTDFSYLNAFSSKNAASGHGVYSPLPTMTLADIAAMKEAYTASGIAAAREGKLAAVLLAGGMGTRLGADGPKGVFDIGVTRPVYIFQRLFENLMKNTETVGRPMHFFIMTSDKNDEETRTFLSEHNYFGYPAEYVHFFRQDMAPAVDEEGHLLLEDTNHLVMSPNGNGGWLKSMASSGMLNIADEAGVEWLNVFAVDNVLQNICDPTFLGAVLERGVACGAKVVRKADPNEKVGVMCCEDGKPSVVEYIEMTDAMRDERTADGDYAYYYGVILNYLFRIKDSVQVMNETMPLHFAHKKIKHIDAEGNTVEPTEPNGWKFEYFIFDLIHELDGCLPFEVDRTKEFAPIKNRTGVDSVDSARALLEQNGYQL